MKLNPIQSYPIKMQIVITIQVPFKYLDFKYLSSTFQVPQWPIPLYLYLLWALHLGTRKWAPSLPFPTLR